MLCKMVGISAMYPLNSPSTEWSWMTVGKWKNAYVHATPIALET